MRDSQSRFHLLAKVSFANNVSHYKFYTADLLDTSMDNMDRSCGWMGLGWLITRPGLTT